MMPDMSSLPSVTMPDSIVSLLISTAILLAAMILFRFLVVRYIRRNVTATELRRKWLVNSRNGLLLLLLLGLILIWGSELRTLALSVVAIAIAFVVATKELILCLSGSLIKSSSSAFNLGDRVQIKDFRGDVIDHNLLTTTLLEVGPGKSIHQRTGRMVTLPNALLVSEPVIKESFTEKFGFHVFSVPFKREDDWPGARQAFLDAAKRRCASYIEDARKHMTDVTARLGLGLPSVEPCVSIHAPTAGEVHLIIRLPVPSGQRHAIEQAILEEVLSGAAFSAAKQPSPGNDPPA